MKRDPRLCGLSEDHHAALVLGRNVLRAVDAGQLDRAARLVEAAFPELAHHFDIEEQVLLPAMSEHGLPALARRLKREHDRIRKAAAAGGDAEALATFGGTLIDHVRLEERVVFPLLEETLPAAVLDRVGQLAPWGEPH